jgi:hypothetical protein
LSRLRGPKLMKSLPGYRFGGGEGPAIHEFVLGQDVDARHKAGHND